MNKEDIKREFDKSYVCAYDKLHKVTDEGDLWEIEDKLKEMNNYFRMYVDIMEEK